MRIDSTLAATLAAVVDEGTLDAAARRLMITPSAVSQRLRALEGELGRVLLVRSKPVRPTESGETIVRLARQLALLEHEALAEFGLEPGADLSSVGAPRRTRVSLAVNADSLATWLLPALARLSAAQRVDVDLRREDQDRTARLLESGDVMAAVTSQERAVAGCTVSPLGTLVYRAVASPDYVSRWFPDGPTRSALAAAPVVDFDRTDDLQSAWLRDHAVDPHDVPRHFVPASHDFAHAVVLGLGWGMLPDAQSAHAFERGNLVVLGEPEIRVPLFWQQWNLRSSLLDAIAREISSAAGEALDPPLSRR